MIGIIVVTGSRHGVPIADLRAALDAGKAHLDTHHKPSAGCILYHGASRGVDRQAHIEAGERGWASRPFVADWEIGHFAGPIRNGRMLKAAKSSGRPVVVVALPRGEARGTTDCINQARGFGLDVLVFEEGS